MYKVYYYIDRHGRAPVVAFIREMQKMADKDSLINVRETAAYIEALQNNGSLLCEPYAKCLDNDIGELRPLRNRILFAPWIRGSYVLLHAFSSRTHKTSVREIEQAKDELQDLIEREC